MTVFNESGRPRLGTPPAGRGVVGASDQRSDGVERVEEGVADIAVADPLRVVTDVEVGELLAGLEVMTPTAFASLSQTQHVLPGPSVVQ